MLFILQKTSISRKWIPENHYTAVLKFLQTKAYEKLLQAGKILKYWQFAQTEKKKKKRYISNTVLDNFIKRCNYGFIKQDEGNNDESNDFDYVAYGVVNDVLFDLIDNLTTNAIEAQLKIGSNTKQKSIEIAKKNLKHKIENHWLF